MTRPLLARLNKIETQFVVPKAVRRCVTVVCNEGDEAAARELAIAYGYEPENDDHLLIIRSLVAPAGRQLEPLAPYMLRTAA